MKKDAKEFEFVAVSKIRNPRNSSEILYAKDTVISTMCNAEGQPLDRMIRMAVRDGVFEPVAPKKAIKKTKSVGGNE